MTQFFDMNINSYYLEKLKEIITMNFLINTTNYVFSFKRVLKNFNFR